MQTTELAVPQRTGCACGAVKERHPDLDVQVESFIVHTDGHLVEWVTFTGTGALEATHELEHSAEPRHVEVLEEGPGFVRLRLEVEGCPLAGVLAATRLAPDLPFPVERGWDRWAVVGQRARIAAALARFQADGISAQLIATRPARRDPGELTAHQRGVLDAAIQAGYYDRPRRTTIRALADRLDLGKSALSETLMTIESKMMRRPHRRRLAAPHRLVAAR